MHMTEGGSDDMLKPKSIDVRGESTIFDINSTCELDLVSDQKKPWGYPALGHNDWLMDQMSCSISLDVIGSNAMITEDASVTCRRIEWPNRMSCSISLHTSSAGPTEVHRNRFILQSQRCSKQICFNLCKLHSSCDHESHSISHKVAKSTPPRPISLLYPRSKSLRSM